jgi:hypothetical protein
MTDLSTADEAAAQAVLGLSAAEPRRDVYFEPPPEEHSGPEWIPDDSPKAPPPAPEPEPEPIERLPEFDLKHREPFTGLLYLGYLDEEFSLFGHRFRVATPYQEEFLQIGTLVKPYQDTISAEKAYEAARVAAYLVEVDRTPLPQPLGHDPKDGAVRLRFSWVLENLRSPVISALFNKCLELEDTVAKVLDAMGKASG